MDLRSMLRATFLGSTELFMKPMVEFLSQHGYWVLFVSVLGRQACLPVPANLLLLAAGGRRPCRFGKVEPCRHHRLRGGCIPAGRHGVVRRRKGLGRKNSGVPLRRRSRSGHLPGQDSQQVQSSRGEIAAGFEVHHRSGRRRRSHGRNITNWPTSVSNL
jgi:hypothetical protein